MKVVSNGRWWQDPVDKGLKESVLKIMKFIYHKNIGLKIYLKTFKALGQNTPYT
jgi:hypothetical protein